MAYTYILISKTEKATYVGSTDDLERRFKEHNERKCFTTKTLRPWELFYVEEYEELFEARKREKYFKSCAGRKFIKKLFVNDKNRS